MFLCALIGVLGSHFAGVHAQSAQAGVLAPIPANEIPNSKGSLDVFPISDHAVICLTTSGGSQPFGNIDGLSVGSLHVWQSDFRQGVTRRLPELESAITSWPWGAFKKSPNGKYLLCVPIDLRHPGRLVDLESFEYRSTVIPPNADVVWLSNSTGFLVFPHHGHPEIPSQTFIVSVPSTGPLRPHELAPQSDGDVPITAALGVPLAAQSDNSVVFVNTYSYRRAGTFQETVDVHLFRLISSELFQAGAYSFDPPDITIYPDSIQVSPKGHRLLWHGIKETGPHVQSWLVYTSNLDGSQLRLLESVRLSADMGALGNPPPLDPHSGFRQTGESITGATWMPDGITICCAVNGSFYLVKDQ